MRRMIFGALIAGLYVSTLFSNWFSNNLGVSGSIGWIIIGAGLFVWGHHAWNVSRKRERLSKEGKHDNAE